MSINSLVAMFGLVVDRSTSWEAVLLDWFVWVEMWFVWSVWLVWSVRNVWNVWAWVSWEMWTVWSLLRSWFIAVSWVGMMMSWVGMMMSWSVWSNSSWAAVTIILATALLNNSLNLSVNKAKFDFVLKGVGSFSVFADLLAHSAFKLEFVDSVDQSEIMGPEIVGGVLLDSDAALLEGWDQWVILWKFWNVVWFLLAESDLLHSVLVNSQDTFVVFALGINTIDSDLSFEDSDSASGDTLKALEFAELFLAELSVLIPVAGGLGPVVEANAFISMSNSDNQPWDTVSVA
jgi:hypothetical protein